MCSTLLAGPVSGQHWTWWKHLKSLKDLVSSQDSPPCAGVSVHPLLFGSLLRLKLPFSYGEQGSNCSFRPSRSICCCCCWTQTLWSPWRPLSSADFRSSGGQRSSPLSTSPDSVGSTTIDGSLLDSLGYFSRESGKAWWDTWGHSCQSPAQRCVFRVSVMHAPS